MQFPLQKEESIKIIAELLVNYWRFIGELLLNHL